MLTGMGLALGIDYSLFVVSRYREERVDGRERLNAIDVAGQTACRAVGFSGSAFVLAMLGMVLVPDTILRSLAVGAILVGITSVAAALTLLPAVLALLGDRVNALRIPLVGRGAGRESRLWGRAVHAVMRRPVVSLAAGVSVLLLAAAPVLDLGIGQSGIRTLLDRFPRGRGSRRCRTRSEWEPSTRQRSWSTATSRLRASGWRSHGCGARCSATARSRPRPSTRTPSGASPSCRRPCSATVATRRRSTPCGTSATRTCPTPSAAPTRTSSSRARRPRRSTTSR